MFLIVNHQFTYVKNKTQNFTKMKIKELLNLITKKTGENFSQSDLARGLGTTRQSVSNRVRNNSEVTISELQKIEKFIVNFENH